MLTVVDERELPPRVRESLEAAGWFPGRSVDVHHWLEGYRAEGLVPSPHAVTFIETFGGLTITPIPGAVAHGTLIVDPDEAQGYGDLPGIWKDTYGESFTPVGVWAEVISVFVGESGRFLGALTHTEWRFGADLGEALATLVGVQDATSRSVWGS
ncbi:SUKH-3 domain-containing protein [Phytomonospora sp. NPDC050363]|uniref:SUKH-3 domain-containing protein n=1 Tax=Phytomonospora sp. NPDC050363 TaxID=3155642 RepID=UPI0033DC6066